MRVLELIFGRGGVEHPPVSNRVNIKKNASAVEVRLGQTGLDEIESYG